MSSDTTLHAGMRMEAAGAMEALSEPTLAPPRTGRLPGPFPDVRDPWFYTLLQAAIAGGGLLLASPLILLVAVAVRLCGPGPILYRGQRVGQGMREFTIYKFRTLRTGAEKEIGARLLTTKDDFYTPIGRFLKRSKLDEIPQLWNVVRGDMNLVGPRPVRPVFDAEFLCTIPGYARRFQM